MFRYSLVWDKSQTTGFLNAKRQPLRRHEDILLFYKLQPTYNPIMRKGKMILKNTGNDTTTYNHSIAMPHYSEDYYPTSIIDIPQVRVKDGHPTQKTVPLFSYLIKTYTNEGDLVLDTCAGSCTTGLAAIQTGRKYICIEKEQKYCEMGQKRINKWKSGDIFFQE